MCFCSVILTSEALKQLQSFADKCDHYPCHPHPLLLLAIPSRCVWLWPVRNKKGNASYERYCMEFIRAEAVVLLTPYTRAEKFKSFERINSMRETNGNFDSCNSCKRLVPSRLHELHESKFPFVSRIEFIRSKLSNFSAHVSGVPVSTFCWDSPTIDAFRQNPGRSRKHGFVRLLYSGNGATWVTRANKNESLERINSNNQTNESFDSYNSCKRLCPNRLHE